MKSRGKVAANGMLRINTPIEDYTKRYALWVKREDMACFKPGPQFSKTRGVYERVASRPENIMGVLDTRHSQGGWAVARACQIIGKKCWVFYPVYKADNPNELRESQVRAKALGARLIGLKAGRSAILYHQVKKRMAKVGGYPIPNALKLDESVTETAKEVPDIEFGNVLIPISSGTIAAGVIKGFHALDIAPKFIIHLGYSRSHDQVLRYLKEKSGVADFDYELIDEGFSYKDSARAGRTPPWPCDVFYDLKAFRWWDDNHIQYSGSTLFWNIG